MVKSIDIWRYQIIISQRNTNMKYKFLYNFITYLCLLCIILLGGYLTLSLANETSWATFSAYIIFYFLGFILKDRKYAYFVIVLLLLYSISAFFVNIQAFFGPFICLAFFCFSYFSNLHTLPKYLFIFLLSSSTAFWAIPRYDLYQSKKNTYTYSLIDTLKIVRYNGDTLLIRDVGNTSKLLLIETWHEHCGSCFGAMRDLHPELAEIEKKFRFKHLYLYSSTSDLPIEEIIKVRYLPYQDLPIFKDIDSNIRKTIGVLGAPVFLLVNTETGTIEEYRGYIKTSKKFFLKDIYDAAKAYPIID